MGHLSKSHVNLLEIHEIGPVDTSQSKQQNYDQIWHMQPQYQKLLGLSYVGWLSHSPVVYCKNHLPTWNLQNLSNAVYPLYNF